MQRKHLNSIVHSFKSQKDASLVAPQYRLWKGNSSIAWNNPNNWSSTGIPSGTSNVLFMGNTKLFGACQIDTDVNVKSIFVRSDYNGGYITIKPAKNITTNNNLRFDAESSSISFNTNTVNINSGNLILDTPQFVSWGRSSFNLSGGIYGYNAYTIGDSAYYYMLGSGKNIYSDISLTNLYINRHTRIISDVVIKQNCVVSGELDIENTLVFDGENAQLFVPSGGQIGGEGDIIIQREGYIAQQEGFIGNRAIIIQNNENGECLSPGSYSCRDIVIRNFDQISDRFSFGEGEYKFFSNFTCIATGNSTLTIDNSLYDKPVGFYKDLILVTGDGGVINWKRGNSSIVLGGTTDMATRFNGYRDGRGYANITENPRGIVVSKTNILNKSNILYVLDQNDNDPLVINIMIDEAHTVGTISIVNITGVQLGDISTSRPVGVSTHQIYIADVADTGANRPMVFIHRTPEPAITGFAFHDGTASSRTLSGVYQTGTNIPLGENGGQARDCRAFFKHFQTNDNWLITHKTSPPQLFYLEQGSDSPLAGLYTFQYAGNLQIPSGVVGADISRDGTEILVKTWDKVYYYSLNGTGVDAIRASLTGTIPTIVRDYDPVYLDHGIAWGSGTRSFYTISTFNTATDDPLSGVPVYHYDSRAHIDTLGIHLDKVVIQASGHQKKLMSQLNTKEFWLDSGIFNINNQTIRTTGNFYSAPGSNYIREGFNNATIAVSGDFLIMGSKSYMLDMLPDSGLGPWQLQVAGSARAYYAQVRGSHASGGNSVYAYSCNDFLYNRNWIFSDQGEADNSMPLFIAGTVYPSSSGECYLYLFGKSGDSTGLLNLYLSGPSSALNSGNLYLYLLGQANTLDSGVPLFCAHSTVTGGVNLFLKSKSPHSGMINLYLQHDGVQSGLPLYTIGHMPTGDTIPLSIFGGLSVSTGVNLIVHSVGLADGINRRLYIHGRHSQ